MLDGRTATATVEDGLERDDILAQEAADRGIAPGVIQVGVLLKEIALEAPVDAPQVVAVEGPYLGVNGM